MSKKAIIVGGSVGGMLAGNMLVRQGWDVAVLERATQGLEARGAGIVPQQALLEALELAGVTLKAELGIPIDRRTGYDRDGKPFAVHHYTQYTTSWGRLYNLLRDAFPSSSFHAGKSVANIVQDEKSATVVLEDGSEMSADIVIGADGMRSTVRNALFPEAQPRYVGYVAWRGMMEERFARPEFIEATFTGLNFSFPKGEELIGYPVAGADGSIEKGERRFNFMWYRPVDPEEGFRAMFTGTDGVFHEHGIPPPLVRPELIAEAKRDASKLLPPQFAEVVTSIDGLFLQAIYDLVSERMGQGRVALIGDAAFVARPHCGAGVSKAAEDAAALTRALSECATVEEAVAAFSPERVKQGKAAVAWAARLGSYFEMDETGHRRKAGGGKPPVSREFIIRNTGIELAEAYRLGSTEE